MNESRTMIRVLAMAAADADVAARATLESALQALLLVENYDLSPRQALRIRDTVPGSQMMQRVAKEAQHIVNFYISQGKAEIW